MAKRNAQGAGTIRQRLDGRWEARYTVGRNPGTGRQIQKSIYGKTQKEVLEKLRKVQTAKDSGIFVEPSKLSVGDWLDTWQKEYLVNVKPSTKENYRIYINNRIKPALGAVKLQKLKPHQVQAFYNSLSKEGIAPKTVKNIHGILHSSLQQAQKIGYLQGNPTTVCTLPRVIKKEMKVLDDDAIIAFLTAIEGHQFETVYFVDLFTGMRQGELLGLTWDSVDFEAGTLNINKQLIKGNARQGMYYLDTLKTEKPRIITPAPIVMQKLKAHQYKQIEQRLKAGAAWSNDKNLVFTNEIGGHLTHYTVYKYFKRIVADIGMPDLRFHDMRHSYAVMAISSGDDLKTVQENLGHSTITTTLDVYGHVTDKMKEESAARMQTRFESLKKNKA